MPKSTQTRPNPSPASARPVPAGRSNVLAIALGVSVTFHSILLAVHFAAPQALHLKPPNNPLDVILVNAHDKNRPVAPEALAQVDLNGGGEQESGRATSFLPNSGQSKDGDTVQKTTMVPALEEQQKKLLAQLRQTDQAVPPDPLMNQPTRIDPTNRLALTESLKEMSRMEAQIEKNVSDYNSRPRRGYIGPTTKGATYALYYSQWKDKVERIGTVNYPEEARGKIYGELILEVTLNPDGTIYNDEVNIVHSSGFPVLDRAAKRIVRLGAPYGHFPVDMHKDYDIFEILTRFRFMRGDGFEADIERR